MRLRPWLLAAALLLLVFAAVAAVMYWRTRPAVSVADQLRRMPRESSAVLFLNLATLRQAGLLSLLEGTGALEDAEYRSFVQGTAFDYREDLDTLMVSWNGRERTVLATGRFNWTRIAGYARANQGACEYTLCRFPSAAAPDLFLSFTPLRSRLMVVTLNDSRFGARDLPEHPQPLFTPKTDDPLWLYLSPSVLQSPPENPPGLASVLGALAQARPVVFSLGGTVAQFEARVSAEFADAPAANAAAARLTANTELLGKLLARENRAPNPADLSGVLTAGRFWNDGPVLRGRWPIARQFLESVFR